MMLLLRFAPRGGDDEKDEDSQLPSEVEEDNFRRNYSSTEVSELAPLSFRATKLKSTRHKKSLASMV
jgi:hypothetical protein